jgi:predicted anti-sigma-YlaC factor YlaD
MRSYEGRWDHRRLTCREVSYQVSTYLDDCLPIPTQIRMTLHLAACGHCRTYVKQVGFVQQTLSLLPKQNPAPINHDLLRRRFSSLHAQ